MIWILKIISKIIISRFQLVKRIFVFLGFFKLGNMNSYEYSFKIFSLHNKEYRSLVSKSNKVLLELGPGLTVTTALLAKAYGFKEIYLVDVGYFAKTDLTFYKIITNKLSKKGIKVPDISKAKTFDEMLKLCNAKYLVNGLDSLKRIPTNSIDFVFSHSVFEHIRKKELSTTLKELNRFMKKGGIASHVIDYQDHLGGGLNNLRFNDELWELDFIANSGFYTNRIPAIEMHQLFNQYGFKTIKENFGKWPSLPISRKSLSNKFKKYTNDELINRTSSILLRKV